MTAMTLRPGQLELRGGHFMSVIGRISTAVVLVLVGGGIALGISTLAPGLFPWSTHSTSESSMVVTALERTEEVALLSAGIQGITEERTSKELFGITIPGGEKAKFIQYEFILKLGIDGADVEISEIGENSYKITIPEFKVIGNSDPVFETVVEDNGVLSWATAETSENDVENKILADENLAQFIPDYEDVLRDQAEHFYWSILRSVDPTIDVTFEFAE